MVGSRFRFRIVPTFPDTINQTMDLQTPFGDSSVRSDTDTGRGIGRDLIRCSHSPNTRGTLCSDDGTTDWNRESTI